jgi:hypothetical protein
MRGATPPAPNTSSWCGAYLSRGTTEHFCIFGYEDSHRGHLRSNPVPGAEEN